MRLVLILLLTIGLSRTALAEDAGPCAAIAAQQDRNVCIGNALRDADNGLDRVYAALSERLDANGQRNLVAAERAWILFRDRECDLRTGYDTTHLENNGTLAPFLVGTCKRDLALQRTADLRAQLKCPGGDLSCPP